MSNNLIGSGSEALKTPNRSYRKESEIRFQRCSDIGSKCTDLDPYVYTFGLDAIASITDLVMERLVKGVGTISNRGTDGVGTSLAGMSSLRNSEVAAKLSTRQDEVLGSVQYVTWKLKRSVQYVKPKLPRSFHHVKPKHGEVSNTSL